MKGGYAVRVSDETHKDLIEEIERVQRKYLRRLTWRYRLRLMWPGLVCGMMFGLLGNVLARAWEDARWSDVACVASLACGLMYLWWTKVLTPRR